MCISGFTSSDEKRQSYIVLSTEPDYMIRDPSWLGLLMVLETIRSDLLCFFFSGSLVFEEVEFGGKG